MKIGRIIALLLLVMNPPVLANEGLQGLGASLCKGVVANGKVDGARLFTWGQGFMSGLNILRHVEGKPMINLNPSDFNVLKQIAYVQLYCSQHPEEEAASAFYQLYKEIAQHHGRSFP